MHNVQSSLALLSNFIETREVIFRDKSLGLFNTIDSKGLRESFARTREMLHAAIIGWEGGRALPRPFRNHLWVKKTERRK